MMAMDALSLSFDPDVDVVSIAPRLLRHRRQGHASPGSFAL
jgi:hypothetical protein